jgi:hypothetical protein
LVFSRFGQREPKQAKTGPSGPIRAGILAQNLAQDGARKHKGQTVNDNPNLQGKNVRRRRETDNWTYRFNIAGVPYSGRCATRDKTTAERIARQAKAQKMMDAGLDDYDARISALEDTVAELKAQIARLISN